MVISPTPVAVVNKGFNFIWIKILALVGLPIIIFIGAAYLMRNTWKERLWLKWGMLFEMLLVAQGLSFLVCFLTKSCKGEWCGIECLLPVLPIIFLGSVLKQIIPRSFPLPIAVGIVLILGYFILGMIVGYVIQKIGSRKHPKVV